MIDINHHWKELIESGETSIQANWSQGIYLRTLTKTVDYLNANKIKREDLKGKILWSLLDVLEKITKFASPKAAEIFWFYIESKWVLKDIQRTELPSNTVELKFIRQPNISPAKIRMSINAYKGVNVARNHI
jgi:hypothetical protein